MGILQTVKGADFSASALGIVFPVTSNLEFINYFGDAATKTGRNLALGKGAPSVVGTPGIGAGYATFTNNTNYVQTALVDQAEVTHLCVARVNSGSPANAFKGMISNFAGTGVNTGSNLWFSNSASSPPQVQTSRNNGTTDASVTAALVSPDNAASFAFYAGRMGAAYNRIDDKTHGLSTAGAVTNPRSTPSTVAYRIGSVLGVAGGGIIDIAFVAIFSRCLTDAEVDAVYQRVKSALATKSIAV